MSKMIRQTVLRRFHYSDLILLVPAIFLYAWYIFPSIKYQYVSTFVGALAVVLSLAIAIFKPWTRHFYKVLLGVTVAYSLLNFLIPGGMIFNIGFLPILENSFFILPMIMAYDIIVRQDRKSSLILVIALSIMFYIVYQATMIVLVEYPNAARDLAQGTDAQQLMEWRFGNVGGFGFSYCTAPIGLILLEMTLKSKGVYRLIAAFFFVYVSIFIFMVQYTTLLVFYGMGCVILLYRSIKNVALRFFIIGCGILVACFMTEILSMLSEAASMGGFDSLAHHFDDFAGTTQGEELRSKRGNIAVAALDLWLDSPLWGNWAVNTPQSPQYLTVMGAHSGVATILASSGIIGLSLHFIFLFTAWKYIHRALIAQDCNPIVFDISFLFLIIVDFINPIFNIYEMPLMTFLLVPVTILYFKKYFILRRNEKQETCRC